MSIHVISSIRPMASAIPMVPARTVIVSRAPSRARITAVSLAQNPSSCASRSRRTPRARGKRMIVSFTRRPAPRRVFADPVRILTPDLAGPHGVRPGHEQRVVGVKDDLDVSKPGSSSSPATPAEAAGTPRRPERARLSDSGLIPTVAPISKRSKIRTASVMRSVPTFPDRSPPPRSPSWALLSSNVPVVHIERSSGARLGIHPP
jgi:hypothetical protein